MRREISIDWLDWILYPNWRQVYAFERRGSHVIEAFFVGRSTSLRDFFTSHNIASLPGSSTRVCYYSRGREASEPEDCLWRGSGSQRIGMRLRLHRGRLDYCTTRSGMARAAGAAVAELQKKTICGAWSRTVGRQPQGKERYCHRGYRSKLSMASAEYHNVSMFRSWVVRGSKYLRYSSGTARGFRIPKRTCAHRASESLVPTYLFKKRYP